jgi:hypothetical protein
MILKGAFFALVCTALLASSGAPAADGYRPDQFFGLDLSQAVLSPKPLGPATQFAPVAVEAKGDRNSEVWWARNELKTEPKKIVSQRVSQKVAVRGARAARDHTAAHVRSERPHGAARTRLARRHGNPLNAQAFDTRIQVWPCRSGGICNWKPAAQ